MTFSYSGDPADSDLDATRFYLTDVTEPAFFSDEELEFLIGKWLHLYGSPVIVAAVAAEMLANRFAREISISGDGVSIDTTQLQARFEQVALNLRDQYKAETGADVFAHDFSGILAHGPDYSLAPLHFGLGQHDNPEAGNQLTGRERHIYGELEGGP